MFIKAILHNKEDDLHFLLKCLVEELENNTILKKEDSLSDDIYGNTDSLANQVNSYQETLLEDETDSKESKDAIAMNKLTSGFYGDVQQAIKVEQKKSPKPLTRQQREKISFDLREKAYKKFISEGKPLEIKGKDFEYKWSVDEIKAMVDTWLTTEFEGGRHRTRTDMLDK